MEAPTAVRGEAMKTILVVIPNLNQGVYLEKNLDRLFSGDLPDISVVLLDAGSTDNSIEIIKRYRDRFTYWRSSPDAGQSAAINEGMGKADTEHYVCWVNADDVVIPERLRDLARFLDKHPRYAAAHGDGRIIDADGAAVGMHYSRPFSPRIFASFNTICQPASLIRRSAWERVGGVEEGLHFGMDYDLWWKLAGVGRIGYVKGVVAHYREHPETKTRSRYREAVQKAIDIVKHYCGYVPLLWVARLRHARSGGDPSTGGVKDINRETTIRKLAIILWAVPEFFAVNGPSGVINCLVFLLFPYRGVKRRAARQGPIAPA